MEARAATSSTPRSSGSSGPGGSERLASGTSWEGELALESDEIIAATGFRAPLRDLPTLGVATITTGGSPR